MFLFLDGNQIPQTCVKKKKKKRGFSDHDKILEILAKSSKKITKYDIMYSGGVHTRSTLHHVPSLFLFVY